MFKCDVTNRFSKLGEKINRIVVERRPKSYYEMRLNEETERYEEVKVGEGWEIVKEISATEEGLKLWQQTQAAISG